jgi:TrmH family RNA methyltransferase
MSDSFFRSRLISIIDPNDVRMSAFAAQRDHYFKSRNEIIVDSAQVVVRLIEEPLAIRSVWATADFYQRFGAELMKRAEADASFYISEHHVLEQVVGHRLHQGIMVIAERPADTPLPLLGNKIVILAGVNNAENTGAILRNCHAFGVDSVLVDPVGSSPWVRRSIRVSMGSAFKLKIHHSADLKSDLVSLKERGYKIYSTGNYEHALPLPEIKWSTRCAVIIGSEFTGVDEEVQKSSDAVIKIPVAPTIDSLNAAVASGVMLFHWSLS